jgi:hypothetical protein
LRNRLNSFDRVVWPGVLDRLLDLFLGRAPWSAVEPLVLDVVQQNIENLRRRVFIAQLCAEAAAFAGEADAVVRLLGHAMADGLFDRHWLEHCVMLAPYRDHPGFVRVRAQITERAHGILDALYGDHAAALSETQVA